MFPQKLVSDIFKFSIIQIPTNKVNSENEVQLKVTTKNMKLTNFKKKTIVLKFTRRPVDFI